MHSLGYNRLENEGTIAVCNALKESKVSKLKELDLENNNITVAGAASVAAYLAVTASLTSVRTLAHKPSGCLPPPLFLLMIVMLSLTVGSWF